MSELTYTHKDLASLLGVSETTVKSYRRKFPGCIPVANQGKPIRFTSEAAAVATRIRDHFETGMSVSEVRARLAAEFPFVSEEGPSDASAGPGVDRAASGGVEVAPELTLGVSNMAKSMVAMTQQQKAILSRMQGIEAMLEELGLLGDPERSDRAARAKAREAALESRLDMLDANTRDLARTVQGMAGQLDRFLGRREKAAEEWAGVSAEVMATARLAAGEATAPAQPGSAQPGLAVDGGMAHANTHPGAPVAAQGMGQTYREPGGSPSGQVGGQTGTTPFAQAGTPAPERVSAQVIPLRAPGQDARERQSEAQRSDTRQSEPRRPQPSLVPGQSAVPEGPAEPPRQFFGLPLVARTEQGQYISAGGKSRGRFSLNDLKAMLIYGFTPPNHFTLRWDRHGQGWWLYLEQENSDRAVHLLLMELSTPKGSVAEILQIRQGGETLHPAEICAVIDSFNA